MERDGDAPAPRELGEGKARAPRPRTSQRFNDRLIPTRLSVLSVCYRLPTGAAASRPTYVPPRRFRATEKVSSHPRRSRPIQREREWHERLDVERLDSARSDVEQGAHVFRVPHLSDPPDEAYRLLLGQGSLCELHRLAAHVLQRRGVPWTRPWQHDR